jgi:methyl-accepting chemotaxis protein
MIAQIASASSQQSSGAQQSSENLDIIHRLSNDAAAAIPETQRTVESVEHEVKRLQEHISHFQLSTWSDRKPDTHEANYSSQMQPSFGD